jgi:hypothetical protein
MLAGRANEVLPLHLAGALREPPHRGVAGDGSNQENLPEDIIMHILLCLNDALSLTRVACCSKQLARLASDRTLWHTHLLAHLRGMDWSVEPHALRAITKRDAATIIARESCICPTCSHLCGVINPQGAAAPPLNAAASAAVGAASHSLLVSSDGRSARFVGERLGGNRAIRCEPSFPFRPFDVLRHVRDEAGVRLELQRDCCIAYYEVSKRLFGRPPASTAPPSLVPRAHTTHTHHGALLGPTQRAGLDRGIPKAATLRRPSRWALR